ALARKRLGLSTLRRPVSLLTKDEKSERSERSEKVRKVRKGGDVRRGWQLACVILLGVFAAALLVSLDYSLSDSLGPGAGFFPFWLSLIGGSLTIAILVQSWRNPDLADTDLSLLSGRVA